MAIYFSATYSSEHPGGCVSTLFEYCNFETTIAVGVTVTTIVPLSVVEGGADVVVTTSKAVRVATPGGMRILEASACCVTQMTLPVHVLGIDTMVIDASIDGTGSSPSREGIMSRYLNAGVRTRRKE